MDSGKFPSASESLIPDMTNRRSRERDIAGVSSPWSYHCRGPWACAGRGRSPHSAWPESVRASVFTGNRRRTVSPAVGRRWTRSVTWSVPPRARRFWWSALGFSSPEPGSFAALGPAGIGEQPVSPRLWWTFLAPPPPFLVGFGAVFPLDVVRCQGVLHSVR